MAASSRSRWPTPTARRICGSDRSWGPDGTILYGGFSGGVMRVSAAGGTPSLLTALDARQERAHAFPKLLPDGRHFLYFRQSITPGNTPLVDAEKKPEPFVLHTGSTTGTGSPLNSSLLGLNGCIRTVPSC
jgi:hypothetical protein